MCVVNQHEATSTQPFSGATRTHPHVATGTEFLVFSALKQSKWQPTCDDTPRGEATGREKRQCSFMSSFVLSCLHNKLSKFKRILCTVSVPFRPYKTMCSVCFLCSCFHRLQKEDETAIVPPCIIAWWFISVWVRRPLLGYLYVILHYPPPTLNPTVSESDYCNDAAVMKRRVSSFGPFLVIKHIKDKECWL